MRRIRSFAALAALAVLYHGCGGAFAQSTAQSPVESRLTGLRLNGKEPIEIESDKLEVLEQENKAIFTGNVSVTQGPTILKSGSMIVYYAKDGGSGFFEFTVGIPEGARLFRAAGGVILGVEIKDDGAAAQRLGSYCFSGLGFRRESGSKIALLELQIGCFWHGRYIPAAGVRGE